MPAQRLAALRILVGGFAVFYVLSLIPMWLSYTTFAPRDFRPLGVVKLLVDKPVPDAVHLAVVIATCVLSIGFLLGIRYRIVGPLFALALLWLLSYRNSWGMPFHTENILVLHVLVLAIVPAADAWSWDARRGPPPPDDERYGWPLRLCAAITAATYVLAGVAKLRLGGMAWTDGTALGEQIAIDNLRKHLMGSSMSPFATPFLESPWLLEVLAIATLVIELGAPLALLHRRLALAWSIGAWGFHAGVVLLMAIVFPYPLAFIAFAPLFRCERPIAWMIRTSRARRARARTAAP